jgi:hypothetical protein
LLPKVANREQIELKVGAFVGGEVVQCQLEESSGGGETGSVNVMGGGVIVQLQMNESTGPLDEPLVESVVFPLFSFGQPEFFENIMGFVVILAVETFKIADVVGIEAGAMGVFDEPGDFG